MTTSVRLYSLILIGLLLLPVPGCSRAQKPISDDQGVAFFMKRVEDNAARGRWEDAAGSVRELEAAWNRDRARLTNDLTRKNVKGFDESLEELKEAVREKDKEDVSEEIRDMRNHYRNITAP